MADIIDFSKYRAGKVPEDPEDNLYAPSEVDTLTTLNQALDAYLGVFTDNELMEDVRDLFSLRLGRLQMVLTITEKVTGVLSALGFSPEEFSIDEASFDNFLRKELPTIPDPRTDDPSFIPPKYYWNGPFFVCRQKDGSVLRCGSTLLLLKEGGAQLFVDLVKREDGHWLVYNGEEWARNDYLDEVDEYHREKMESQEWADEWLDEVAEAGIFVWDLCLSDRVVNALVNAGIETTRQLCSLTEEELRSIPGIGPKAIEEIEIMKLGL